MNFTFNNSSVVSINSGTIVLNVSGKTRTFVDAKLVSAVGGEIVLDLPQVSLSNGAYRTVHLKYKRAQRTFISNTNNERFITYHITQCEEGLKCTGSWGSVYTFRNATPEEIQELNDQLAAEGKQWNPDTMQIEKLRWKPKQGENYFTIIMSVSDLRVSQCTWESDTVDNNVYRKGNCFKTREEAEAKLEQINKLFLEV